MALLDFFNKQPEDPNSQYGDSRSGLLGLFNADQSGSLQEIGSILSGLAYGKPVDMGALSYNRMLRDQRSRQDKKERLAHAYADKVRKSNPELADMIDTNPDYIDHIMGKQIDDMLDPEAQFAKSMLGGGDANEENQALTDNVLKQSGFTDLTPVELSQLKTAALAGGKTFSAVLERITDNRRQQGVIDQAAAVKKAQLDSVLPFIDSIRDKDPELAAALEQNPAQAVELMQKKHALDQNTEVQTYRDIFSGVEPGFEREFSEGELATIKRRTGLKEINQDIAARLYANGEEKLGETVNQINDEITSGANTAAIAERNKLEQSQQNENKITTIAGQFRDDYDRRTKGYNAILDAGRQTFEAIKNPRGTASEQMMVVYSFIKGLDSISAVKEGEVGLAQQTGSYIGQADMYLQKVKDGTIMPEQAYKEMKDMVMQLARFSEKRLYQVREEYKARAKENGIPESRIFGPLESEIDMTKMPPSEFGEPDKPTIVNGVEVVPGG